KENVFDLEWTEGISYRDIFFQAEFENSTYAFETSNTDMLLTLFDTYEREATRQMQDGLVFPAYDYVLKCSHTFNLLDARGVVSVTERAQYIGRIRNLARRIAKTFYESREKLGFPLLKEEGGKRHE
ncbi:glycine--tRNA ligase subunit alpha, partial [Listeria monocytogenes]|nr:glycine--tRNA ligase subunit alpha [Listeria monocytogenes]